MKRLDNHGIFKCLQELQDTTEIKTTFYDPSDLKTRDNSNEKYLLFGSNEGTKINKKKMWISEVLRLTYISNLYQKLWSLFQKGYH